jgi:hypothetical protein
MARDDEDDVEYSPAGNPIYRHKPQDDDLEIVGGDEGTIEAVSDHVEAHLGPVAGVFHEIVSDKVHLDVHVVHPTKKRKFHTLVTSGMSDRPMTLPEGVDAHRFAELCISLPADWDLRYEAFEDETVYWPIRWLKMMARLPHDYRTWLGFGHTVPNGDPPEPFAENTDLCCMLVLPPVQLPDAFQLLTTPAGKEVVFYTLVPLYREEMEYKLEKGTEALLNRLDKHGIGGVVDPGRVNACQKRRR